MNDTANTTAPFARIDTAAALATSVTVETPGGRARYLADLDDDGTLSVLHCVGSTCTLYSRDIAGEYTAVTGSGRTVALPRPPDHIAALVAFILA